jgi:hypothetical protein
MHIVLWAVQIALALKTVSVTYTHAVRPVHPEMQRGMQRFGTATRPLLIVIGVCAFLAAVGLVLPAATGILAWLTPWAAALLALMMLLATGFHVMCRENPRIAVSLVIFVLAAVVAYGRWVIAPF